MSQLQKLLQTQNLKHLQLHHLTNLAQQMPMTLAAFRKRVLAHCEAHGRHTLPWRKTRDPYKILVSEVMLQQTQVDRVIPFYTSWLQQFPNVEALSDAPLADVLRAWQGLGYNRRAKMLHEAARVVVKKCGGKMPRTVSELEALPGVGPYTARAVAAFAYNQPVVFIETNLRTAVTHHFFREQNQVRDADILALLERALPKRALGNKSKNMSTNKCDLVAKKRTHQKSSMAMGEEFMVSPRQWYSALMDYGAFLKKSGVRVNKKSTTYTKQKAFKGSGREVRGAILKSLAAQPATAVALRKLFTRERSAEVDQQLAALQKEGLLEKQQRVYQLPKN